MGLPPQPAEEHELYFQTQGGDIDQLKKVVEEICANGGEYSLEVLSPLLNVVVSRVVRELTVGFGHRWSVLTAGS